METRTVVLHMSGSFGKGTAEEKHEQTKHRGEGLGGSGTYHHTPEREVRRGAS